MGLGFSPGPIIGKILTAVEDAQLNGDDIRSAIRTGAAIQPSGKLRDLIIGIIKTVFDAHHLTDSGPLYASLGDRQQYVNAHARAKYTLSKEALRDGLGPDLGLLLDLNFNAKTEGYLKILRAIADIDMFWVEIDSYNPQALAYIRSHSPHPISSCETLLGLREFLPYFREQAMDVAIIDTPWNGVWQSMKIAAAAEAHEVNVAPHNFYGHLCTMMNAHFAASVPNLRIMEIDIDRLPWDDELFTTVPKIENGHLVIPDTPGWGIAPNEEALKAHPPKGQAGLLDYGRKSS